MTNKEMRAEILSARSLINEKMTKIDRAIANRKLPKLARSTYFYQSVSSIKNSKSPTMNLLKTPVSKLKKSDLKLLLVGLEKLKGQSTSTVAGVKNRLEEEKISARSVMISYGFEAGEVEGFNARQLSDFFRFVDLLRDLYNFGSSDEAIRKGHEIHEQTGKSFASLYKLYKTADIDIE